MGVEIEAAGQRIDIAALPTLEDYGYVGGRESLQAFYARAFAADGPRFLRTADGALAVFRHADVRALAAAPEMAAMAPAVLFPGAFEAGGGEAHARFPIADLIKNQLFTTNPPLNPALRRVLLNQIGPKPTASQAEAARAIADDILARLPRGEPVDLVRQIAEPLTGRYWGALLHMPDAEADATAVEARRMSPMLSLRHTVDGTRAASEAATAYRALVETAASRAEAQGGCPFVAGVARDLAAIEIPDDLGYGGVKPHTAAAFLAGNLFDGFHTAAVAAANTLYVLLRHPSALEAVRADPGKAGAAVAEALRLEPPVIHLNRIAVGDVACDGAVIPAGAPVVLMWGAANHDPDAFPEPSRFDLDRPQQGSTTFGGGAHICPGRFAASLIARTLVEALLAANLDARAAPDAARWADNSAMSQLERFPIVLSRRDAA